MIETYIDSFLKIFGSSSRQIRAFRAPGRVNLIGEHIDYCGGFVFPAALTLDICVLARENGSKNVRMAASDLDGVYTFDFNKIDEAHDLKWGNYQAGVCKELINKGLKLEGLDMLYISNIPFGSGLSSSAAIELATAVAFRNIFDGPSSNVTNIDLAVISQTAEHNFCNVNCGIMDQFTSAMGKSNNAILLDCATLKYEYSPLNLGDYSIVLANTKKKHSLGTSKYNERRSETQQGLDIINSSLSNKKNNLCEISSSELQTYKKLFADKPIIWNRISHVVNENERVIKAVKVLKDGNLVEFGKLLCEANDSIRNLYEATGDELDAMYDAAHDLPSCIGSRMTGGGFGGCTINIVQTSEIETFKKVVESRYTEKTGITPEFYVCKIGDGAREISLNEI